MTMSEKDKITRITIDVPCVVAGKNRVRGADVDVSAEDGKYLVGSGRAVVAGTDAAKGIKAEVKKGILKPGKNPVQDAQQEDSGKKDEA